MFQRSTTATQAHDASIWHKKQTGEARATPSPRPPAQTPMVDPAMPAMPAMRAAQGAPYAGLYDTPARAPQSEVSDELPTLVSLGAPIHPQPQEAPRLDPVQLANSVGQGLEHGVQSGRDREQVQELLELAAEVLEGRARCSPRDPFADGPMASLGGGLDALYRAQTGNAANGTRLSAAERRQAFDQAVGSVLKLMSEAGRFPDLAQRAHERVFVPAKRLGMRLSQEQDPAKEPAASPAPTAPAAPAPGEAAATSRPLLSEELAYAREIFGESVDYAAVTLTRDSLVSTGATKTLGNVIHMQNRWGEADVFQRDGQGHFTMALTDAGHKLLVHEMTHVWQYQHGGLAYIPDSLIAQGEAIATTGSRDGAYAWSPAADAGTPWANWNPEQQAKCVEDYNSALRSVNQAAQGGQPPRAEDIALIHKAQPYIDQVRSGRGAPRLGLRHLAGVSGAAAGAVMNGPIWGAAVGDAAYSGVKQLTDE